LANHLAFRVVEARTRRTVDHYEQGCSIESEDSEDTYNNRHKLYRSIPEAFKDIWPRLGLIDAKEFGTIDNGIYCDTKQGTKKVDDKDSRGVYRVTTNRMENAKRRTPTPEEKKSFEKCERTLFLADYEIEFQIVLVGLNEMETAELVGVSNF
jgi:hypothetical protein